MTTFLASLRIALRALIVNKMRSALTMLGIIIGGMLGIAIGISGTYVLSTFAEWPTLLSVKAILLAFTFAGSVGVFFGFYPARKASLLNPIEALRFE